MILSMVDQIDFPQMQNYSKNRLNRVKSVLPKNLLGFVQFGKLQLWCHGGNESNH